MTSLYVHIPFCERKCFYCDFCSNFYDKSTQERYFSSLKKEIENKKIDDKIETIFIGGGTPSCVESWYICDVMDKIFKNYKICSDCEIAIECNPNSVTEEKIKDYKSVGVNRVSLGVQTTNDLLLKNIGRIHNYNDFLKSAKIIANNFDNFNFDLMIGLPEQKNIDVENALNEVLKFNPTHISVYSLILEPNTAFHKMVKTKKITLPTDELVVEQYNLAFKILKKNFYNRYEISNFSKINYESKHNLNYWNCGEYLGFGLSAHSFKNGIRFANTKNMSNYNNGETTVFKETLSISEQKEEMIMLSLRTENGLELSKYQNKFNVDLLDERRDAVENLLKMNLIEILKDRLKIKTDAFYVSNYVIQELI